jgi:hypothetical protein
LETSSATEGKSINVSQLDLVDLAGYERKRLKESDSINASLKTLGQVVKMLSDGARESIPYRWA